MGVDISKDIKENEEDIENIEEIISRIESIFGQDSREHKFMKSFCSNSRYSAPGYLNINIYGEKEDMRNCISKIENETKLFIIEYIAVVDYCSKKLFLDKNDEDHAEYILNEEEYIHYLDNGFFIDNNDHGEKVEINPDFIYERYKLSKKLYRSLNKYNKNEKLFCPYCGSNDIIIEDDLLDFHVRECRSCNGEFHVSPKFFISEGRNGK